MTIKDNLLVASLPATWGSALYADYMPARDEAPIARLRAAGAVFVGKTNVPELTLQGYSSNLLFGTTCNPHALAMTPGGSTGGGAAAVAAGIGPVAIGTDGGGSLRRPAAHCGLYALKPSIGQVARYGGFPEILADFEVVGPIARTAGDLRLVFNVLRGYDPIEPSSQSALSTTVAIPEPCRIAYLPKSGAAPVDPEIARATDNFAAILQVQGHYVDMIEAPIDIDEVGRAWSVIASVGLHWHLKSLPVCDGLGANAAALDGVGAGFTASDYVAAMATARDARQTVGRFFQRYDLVLCPSTAALAWPANDSHPALIDGQSVSPRGHAVFTGWMNVAGICAVNIPISMTPEYGGIGIQLAARAGGDTALLDFVCNLMTARDFARAPLSRRLAPHD